MCNFMFHSRCMYSAPVLRRTERWIGCSSCNTITNAETRARPEHPTNIIIISLSLSLSLSLSMGMRRRHAHAWMDGLDVHMQLHTMAWDLFVPPSTTTTTNNRRRGVATWMLYYNACMSMRAHGCQEMRVASSSGALVRMLCLHANICRQDLHNTMKRQPRF